MKIFSDELSVKAVINNTLYGLQILVDEWYWLFSQSLFNYKIKKLNKEFEELGNNPFQQEKIKTQIVTLTEQHEAFRKMQIERRLQN